VWRQVQRVLGGTLFRPCLREVRPHRERLPILRVEQLPAVLDELPQAEAHEAQAQRERLHCVRAVVDARAGVGPVHAGDAIRALPRDRHRAGPVPVLLAGLTHPYLDGVFLAGAPDTDEAQARRDLVHRPPLAYVVTPNG